MNAHEILNSVISDLKKIRAVCREQHLDRVPDVAMEYLLTNYHLLQFYLDELYDRTNEADRAQIFEAHPELDYSASLDSFGEIVKGPLVEVKKRWPDPRIRFLVLVTEDDMDMLLRALKYLQYYPFR